MRLLIIIMCFLHLRLFLHFFSNFSPIFVQKTNTDLFMTKIESLATRKTLKTYAQSKNNLDQKIDAASIFSSIRAFEYFSARCRKQSPVP